VLQPESSITYSGRLRKSGEPVKQLVEVSPGELPLEGPCHLLVTGLEGDDVGSDVGEREDLALKDREVDLDQGLILVGMSQEPEPIPHGLEHIESIAERLRSVLTELLDANRANYPPGAWDPSPLQWRFMQANDGLLEAELALLQAIQEIRTEQRRRPGRPCGVKKTRVGHAAARSYS
jgi:hypothetical protein